jgi:hypothetical protein
MLRKNPGFTIVAVLTLALGIGVNTTVFTLVNAVLFKGLPYEDLGPVFMVTSNNRKETAANRPYPDFLDMKAQSKAFKGLAAAQMTLANISDPDMPATQYNEARISSNTFSLLGQRPLLGRDFLPEEDQGSGVRVTILGYDLWKSRYGGDPNILGRHISLNEEDFTVVGVMPEGVAGSLPPTCWTWRHRAVHRVRRKPQRPPSSRVYRKSSALCIPASPQHGSPRTSDER